MKTAICGGNFEPFSVYYKNSKSVASESSWGDSDIKDKPLPNPQFTKKLCNKILRILKFTDDSLLLTIMIMITADIDVTLKQKIICIKLCTHTQTF